MYRVLQILGNVEFGGAQTFIMNVFRSIDREAYSFDFYVAKWCEGGYNEEIGKLGGRIIEKSISKHRFAPIRIFSDFYHDLVFFKKNKTRYQAIHIHTNSSVSVLTLLAAKMAGIRKRIIHSHSTNTKSRGTHFLLRPLIPLVATDMIACGDAAGRFLYGSAFNKRNILTNAIDTERFRYSIEYRESIREEMSLSNSIVVGHVGRFDKVKNHKFLIDVFSEIIRLYSDSMLMLVGTGIEMENIKAYIEEKGLENHVMFLGNRTDVYKLMSAFDIIIFPSFHEGVPITLIEAQANGLQILASDTVSSECSITSCYNSMSLDQNPEVWASEALDLIREDSNEAREQRMQSINNSNYDIRTLMNKIYKLYV